MLGVPQVVTVPSAEAFSSGDRIARLREQAAIRAAQAMSAWGESYTFAPMNLSSRLLKFRNSDGRPMTAPELSRLADLFKELLSESGE